MIEGSWTIGRHDHYYGLDGLDNGDDLKLHDDLASVDKPVDAEAELKKEEAEHAAAMQRIAQQVEAGSS